MAVTGIYKVTISSGTHLEQLKNGTGNIGTVLNNNRSKIASQAILNAIRQ